MSKTNYPYWEKDRVTDQISKDHFVTVELRDGGSGAISLTELTKNRRNRYTFRQYVDVALMSPEHFRMVVDHFLQDSISKGMHGTLATDDIIDRIVVHKVTLENQRTPRAGDLYLHCGSIDTHDKHTHREGRMLYFCEGWSND